MDDISGLLVKAKTNTSMHTYLKPLPGYKLNEILLCVRKWVQLEALRERKIKARHKNTNTTSYLSYVEKKEKLKGLETRGDNYWVWWFWKTAYLERSER